MEQIIKLGETSISTTVVALVVVLLATIYYLIKNRNILPGPKGVPYLGLFPILNNENVHLQLTEYAKEYGDAYSFTYLGQLFIHIGSVKVLRELHITKSDCFVQRTSAFNILNAMVEDAVLTLNGDAWKTHRKFFILKFKEYGLNSLRDTLSGPVSDAVEATLKSIIKKQKQPVNTIQLMTGHCTQLLRTILFGESGITDEEIYELNVQFSAMMDDMTGTALIMAGPLARFLFAISSSAQTAFKANNKVKQVLYSSIARIKANMNEESPTCVIEEYFSMRNRYQKQGDPIWKSFTDKSLVSSIAQIAGDSIGTVALFITNFLNALVAFPDAAEKVYQEIMDVVGPNRQPTLDDKSNMPYTTAFTNEVMRTSTLMPIFPSLECTKETSCHGFRIPKGAITLENFYAIHHNPDTYENPDEFNPSRYLSAPGKPKAELPVTFGIGKRSCSGEAFVMAQTFLFLTAIVKNFKIISSNNPQNSDIQFLLSGQLELQFEARPGVEI